MPTRRSALHAACFAAVAVAYNLGLSATIGEVPPIESMALARAEGVLGVAHANLERAPWLDDQVRAWALASVGDATWVLRLSGTLAATLASLLAWRMVWLAAACLAQPRLQALAAFAGGWMSLTTLGLARQTWLAHGTPWGCLLAVAATWAWTQWVCGAPALRRDLARVGWAGCLSALACAGVGAWFGVVLPLVSAALHPEGVYRRRCGLALLAGAWAMVVFYAVWRQGDGFVPLLGAAKSLQALHGTLLPATATLASLAHDLWPWLAVIVGGWMTTSDDPWHRYATRWSLVWLTGTSVWSTLYPAITMAWLPTWPLLAWHGLLHMANGTTPGSWQRWRLTALLILTWILLKHASFEAILAALGPDAATMTGSTAAPRDLIATLTAKLHGGLLGALVLVLVAVAIGAGQRARAFTRHGKVGVSAAWLVLALAIGSWTIPSLARTLAAHFGYSEVFAHWQRWQQQGVIPAQLGVRMANDPGIARAYPSSLQAVELDRREDLLAWLRPPESRAALINRGDLASLHQQALGQSLTFSVLGEVRHDLYLVTNQNLDGDTNPLRSMVLRAVPPDFQATRINFGATLRLVGWREEAAVQRGGEAMFDLLFEVMAPVPSQTEFIVRLQQGRLGRLGGKAETPLQGLYPPSFWRAGDFIRHRAAFEVPMLLTLPGTYDVMVGVKKTGSEHIVVSSSDAELQEVQAQVRGGKREFAAITKVDVR